MASETIEDRLLSVRETSKLLGISTRQLHRLRNTHKLCPDLKVGGSIRIRLSTLIEWLDMNCPDRATFLARKEEKKC